MSVEIVLVTGIKWRCKHCKHSQPSVEDEERQFHCNDTMSMIPFYKLEGQVTDEPKDSQ